ncbi:hypothetical protein MBUL_00176 [Methylobacterium bullatum]|uniref:Uncharacterized protein n=1 Tax=Methylobacterium bullatum TaxID=570505 RepID=A0A679IKH2_9HYPH|nr:hypothetical protein MBUL_00176 [Methylobacterium bullatum]
MANRLTLNTVAEVTASAGLEGGLQTPQRSLEGSFEAAPRHLRMR